LLEVNKGNAISKDNVAEKRGVPVKTGITGNFA
jgi:hypothetical protein